MALHATGQGYSSSYEIQESELISILDGEPDGELIDVVDGDTVEMITSGGTLEVRTTPRLAGVGQPADQNHQGAQVCEQCQGPLIREQGCVKCLQCGASRCG